MHTRGSSLMLGVFIPSVHSVLSPSPLPWHSHPRQMKHCLIQNQPIRVRIISSRQRQRRRTWRMERLPRRYEITTTTMMSILQWQERISTALMTIWHVPSICWKQRHQNYINKRIIKTRVVAFVANIIIFNGFVTMYYCDDWSFYAVMPYSWQLQSPLLCFIRKW